MAFNGPPNPPPPPPPPPHHGGTHHHPPPPPPPNPFWDFINAMDPNYRAGFGVDHTANFPNGFNFGPSGFEAWSGPHGFHGGWGRRGGHHHGRRHDRDGAEGWGSWGWGWPDNRGPGDRRRERCGGRCRRNRHSDDERSGDEEMRDVAAAVATAEGEAGPAGERDPEKAGSPATMRGDAPEGDFPDPPEEEPEAAHPFALPHRGRGPGPHRGRGGHRGPHRFGPHGGPHGRPHGHHGPFRGPPPPVPAGGPPPPPPYGAAPPLDIGAVMGAALGDHPFAQRIRSYVERNIQAAHDGGAAAGDETENENVDGDDFLDGENTFVPPVDIFNSSTAWTIHLALPGAHKEDIAINWDASRGKLAISGVVHRLGDQEFLNGLVSGERKVGLFERSIKLPPAGVEERDEIDEDGITARMENGVLIVVVPKVEKEWTEVKKVDIE